MCDPKLFIDRTLIRSENTEYVEWKERTVDRGMLYSFTVNLQIFKIFPSVMNLMLQENDE